MDTHRTGKFSENGVFLLYHDGQKVKALRGMNSLVSLRQGQNAAWKKIRTIRVMDAINQDLLRTAEEGYIGKVNNTEEGRLALVESAKQYMQTLAQAGVIEAASFDVYLNPAYYGETAELTPEPDQVYIKWDAQLTDVMEQILALLSYIKGINYEFRCEQSYFRNVWFGIYRWRLANQY